MSILQANGAGLGGAGDPGGALAGGVYSYNIDQSLRVDDAASQRMYHTTVAGSAQKFTMSCWIKRTEIGSAGNGTIMSSWNGASNFVNMYFSGDYLYCYICDNRSGFVDYNFGTAASGQFFRDVTAWMHIVMAVDTTQANIDDRAKIWINGVSVDASSNGSGNDIPQNYNMEINESPGQTFLFHNPDSATYYGSFYIAELVYVDGTQYDADTFGEFNNGIWTPLDISAQSISFGNNGFYLDFADSSDLGKDVSGEGHHFTSGTRSAVVSNFDAHDQVLDSPTNNFATWNVAGVQYGGTNAPTITEGSLKAATSGNPTHTYGTFALQPTDTQGYYWEVKATSIDTARSYMGIVAPEGGASGSSIGSYQFKYKFVLNRNDDFYGDDNSAGGGTVNLTSWTTNDILMFAYKDGKFWIGKNGTWMNSGDPAGGTGDLVAADGGRPSDRGDVTWYPYVGFNSTYTANFGQDSTFAGTETAGGNSDENGYGDFKYSVPSGFLAMCSANLPEPTIGPNSAEQADDYFDTKLWSSDVVNPSAGQKQISLNFQPDLVWSKNRDNAEHHYWMDSVRGDNDGSKWLKSNATAAEGGDAIGSTTAKYDFTSTGFDIIDTNSASGEVYYNNGNAATPRTYVGWCWKAGGTASSIAVDAYSAGVPSIASSVSAAPDAGFSIVSWTGNATNPSTIGHGLSSAPEMIILKNRDSTGDWYIGHDGIGWTDRLKFTTATTASSSTLWNNTAPTSSVFTISSALNFNGDATIAYCFHSVEGYSKVGSYVGNGSADGTFVYTGFRPAFVLVKSSSLTYGWAIVDTVRNTYNVINSNLFPHATSAEDSSTGYFNIDAVSNGFKVRTSNAVSNQSGGSYIYLAFAEAPFKYANAR